MSGADRPAIVIAAGGAGLRMGGNKPGRLLAGRRLIDHAIAWARQASDCLALAVAGQDSPDAAGLPALPDAAPERGPIAALASAFAFAAAQDRSHVILIACDMPLLPSDLVARLAGAIGGAGAAMPRRGGYLHPLAALWRAEPVRLAGWIDAGGRAPRSYAADVGLVAVDWPATGVDPFRNVNSPEDVAAVEALLKTPER